MNAGVMTRLISIWALVMVSSVYAEEMIDFFSMSPAMPQELEVTCLLYTSDAADD